MGGDSYQMSVESKTAVSGLNSLKEVREFELNDP